MLLWVIFVIIPLLEISVFILVGDEIGLGMTLLLSLVTAILGGLIVKYQGVLTILAVREALGKGRLPLDALFDGICLVAAGALLITPGFVTDTIGFLLLVPAFRSFLRHVIRSYTDFYVESFGADFGRGPRDPRIIEVEYETLNGEDDLK